MPLRIYQDDCLNSKLLSRLLREAGHETAVPADVGMEGRDDPDHFAHAVENGLVLLTANPSDFEALHLERLARSGSHPGVLAVYQDNDQGRDMSAAQIVEAIGRLEAFTSDPENGYALAGNFHRLNDWRG